MKQSESVAKLSAALAIAQASFEVITKNKIGQEGNQRFPYSTLSQVLDAVRPSLNAQGIFLSQPIVVDEQGNQRVTTRVQLSEEYIQTDGILLTQGLVGSKKLGLEVTYSKRYDLISFLGVCAEDDDKDAPDLKPSSVPNTATTFRKPVNTPEQVKEAVTSKVNPEITDADLPPFGDTNREPVVKLRPEDAALIDELSNFVPLSEGRNREIQNQLKEWVKNKTFSLRSLTTYLDKEHGGKKQFDVSAQQWEQTFSKISSAVDAGSDSIKQLLKG